MAEFELYQDPGCEEAEGAEEDNDYYAWDEANDCEGGGKRQHAVADNLRNHQDGDKLP